MHTQSKFTDKEHIVLCAENPDSRGCLQSHTCIHAAFSSYTVIPALPRTQLPPAMEANDGSPHAGAVIWKQSGRGSEFTHLHSATSGRKGNCYGNPAQWEDYSHFPVQTPTTLDDSNGNEWFGSDLNPSVIYGFEEALECMSRATSACAVLWQLTDVAAVCMLRINEQISDKHRVS